jgi:serine/threonine-protein kinase
VILFETLTTRVPFEAETVTQLTAMVLQDTPRAVDELRSDVPAGLARVIARCLEKDPANRYASVADLAHDLEPFGSLRGVALRISQVTGPRTIANIPLSSGRLPTGNTGGGGTSVAWGDTLLASPRGRRTAIVVAVVVGLVVLVGGAMALAFRAGHASAAAGVPAIEVTPTVRQINLAPPAPSIPPAVVPVAPPAIASAPAPAPPPASAAAPPPAPKPPAAHPSPPKPAKHPNDDLPDERN